MRRLGGVLGVEAMSLYRYVPGREDLLDGVVETILDEMHDDTDVLVGPRDGWQDFLQRIAHGVRRVALAHPPPSRWWPRGRRRRRGCARRCAACAGSSASSRGCSPKASPTRRPSPPTARSPASCSATCCSRCRRTVPTSGRSTCSTTARPTPGLHRYPQVPRLGDALAEDHAAVEFEESLENLLDRIALIQLQTPGD